VPEDLSQAEIDRLIETLIAPVTPTAAIDAERNDHVVVLAEPGSGKSVFTATLIRALTGERSAHSLRRDIAELDLLHDQLKNEAAFPRQILIVDNIDSDLPPHSFERALLPAADPPVAPVFLYAETEDPPWSSVIDLSFSAVGPWAPGQPIPFNQAQRPLGDGADLEISTLAWHPPSLVLAVNEALLPYYRQGLLRLIDGIRTVLRLILIRVLSALSRCPDAINIILVILASSRHFGHRTEPDDHPLPVLTSISVVTGRLPACVS